MERRLWMGGSSGSSVVAHLGLAARYCDLPGSFPCATGPSPPSPFSLWREHEELRREGGEGRKGGRVASEKQLYFQVCWHQHPKRVKKFPSPSPRRKQSGAFSHLA